MNEIQIKIQLFQYLRAKHPNAIFACEVPFAFGERRADVVMLKDGMAHVFEIKSAGDCVDRLLYQIEGYKKFFDFCHVVGEPSNLDHIRRIVPKDIGLLTVSPTAVSHLRKASQQHKFDKLFLASIFSIPKLVELQKSLGLRPQKQKLSQFERAKLVALNSNIDPLLLWSRTFLAQKYRAGTEYLAIDALDILTADDIMTISRQQPCRIRR